MGFGDCDKDPQNGCEVATGSDVKNCGGCGVACNLPNATALCVGGACDIGACNPGFRDCDANPANGCEVDTNNDPMNCGACNANCAKLPHAIAGCAMAACTIGSCTAGYADCDKMVGDGCESQVASDPMNCGGCGKVCPAPPNVATTCANGMCGLGGCLPGFADCDGNAANGCEVNLMTDPNNCSMCGMKCAALPNAQASCTMGVCGLGACNAGFGNCDKDPMNGCELSLTSDNNNCGACGNVCQNGQTCTNGVCGVPCGNDCWGPTGCMTAGGHCIQFTCRAGDAGGSFCNGCKGWKEVTYSMWLNQGWCADVTAKYRSVEGNNTKCGGAGSCCGSSGACSGGDNAWHFFDTNSNQNYYVGPCLGCGGTDCTYWNNTYTGSYTRLTACQKF
jgi:hypothetical protein